MGRFLSRIRHNEGATRAGCRPKRTLQDRDNTFLIVAAGQPNHDDVSFLEELIDAGADPNAPDEDGKTALMSAAENGHVSKVRFLLENGASVNARDKSGKTALRYARPPRNKNDDDFPQCYESLSSDDLKPNNDCEATRRLLKSRM